MKYDGGMLVKYSCMGMAKKFVNLVNLQGVSKNHL